jgi:hypothetical protein
MRMRNSWKGLVVGGLTGAVVGIALDLLASAMEQITRGAKHAREGVEHSRELAPEAMEWLQGVTDKAAEWVHDAGVPERVREVAQRILDADFASTANVASSKVLQATMDRARSTLHHSS